MVQNIGGGGGGGGAGGGGGGNRFADCKLIRATAPISAK